MVVVGVCCMVFGLEPETFGMVFKGAVSKVGLDSPRKSKQNPLFELSSHPSSITIILDSTLVSGDLT